MPDPARIICPTCGVDNDPGTRFCINCGTRLPETAARTEPAAPAESPYDYPAQPATFTPQPQPYSYQPGAEPPGYSAPPSTPTGYGAQPGAWQQPTATPRRNTLLLVGVAVGALVALCLLMVATLLVLRPANISIFTPPTATPLEASDILTRSADRMDDVKTVHYRMVGEFSNVGSSGNFSINLNGNIKFPDSYTMDREGSGKIVVIGPDAWVQDIGSTRWLKVDSSQAASPTTNPAALARFIRYPKTAIVDSDYMSGTQHLYRLNFKLDTLALASGEGQGSAGEALLGTDTDADAVVDADTYLLQELTLTITADQNSGAHIRIVFSDFDAPVTITPPEQ